MSVILNPRALQDAAHHAAYLEESAGIDVALRFLDHFRQTVENLAQMPGIGSPYHVKRASIKLRYSAVRKFRKHLVFYRELADGDIEVMRLLHAAQNVRAILEREA